MTSDIRARLLATVGLTALLTACGYAVSVNERVVYTPPTLFTDYRLDDRVLHTCVEQSIIDQGVSEAAALRRLDCSHAGIRSLAGIEIFTGIEELNLAENELKDVAPLASLSRLKLVLLNKNQLESAAPLLALLHLERLELRDNPSLACGDLAQLQSNYADQPLVLLKPAQCS